VRRRSWNCWFHPSQPSTQEQEKSDIILEGGVLGWQLLLRVEQAVPPTPRPSTLKVCKLVLYSTPLCVTQTSQGLDYIKSQLPLNPRYVTSRFANAYNEMLHLTCFPHKFLAYVFLWRPGKTLLGTWHFPSRARKWFKVFTLVLLSPSRSFLAANSKAYMGQRKGMVFG
jgi:hypothetical protein